MGAIWAMSLTTSPGMWPVHLDSASKFTGLMTWSVDRSILGRKERLDGAQADAHSSSLLSHSGAAGKAGGTWPWASWALLNCETVGKSLGLIIATLYNRIRACGGKLEESIRQGTWLVLKFCFLDIPDF